ncbi:hypothetical protein J5N97_018658 [Dioscorea zingiberensis]|uniref:RanBP2-type domain-containing protein n=1 Tax=Dioscorea zingiberensis TaxID=325984 RepID=A0A9D5HBP9_9LILI|nr:hypothetical protein J5N97_018658 [Dioscorea zingiberensis]
MVSGKILTMMETGSVLTVEMLTSGLRLLIVTLLPDDLQSREWAQHQALTSLNTTLISIFAMLELHSQPHFECPDPGSYFLRQGMESGTGPIMDRYGYGFQGSPPPATGLCSSGDLPDNNASQKHYRGPPDFQGCWSCSECNNLNFSFSNTCNMRKCGAPRPTTASHLETGQLTSPMLADEFVTN